MAGNAVVKQGNWTNHLMVLCRKGLDLSLRKDPIHGLVGENGAGKSTFIKILGGVYTKSPESPRPGTVFAPAEFGTGGKLSWESISSFQDHVLVLHFPPGKRIKARQPPIPGKTV